MKKTSAIIISIVMVGALLAGCNNDKSLTDEVNQGKNISTSTPPKNETSEQLEVNAEVESNDEQNASVKEEAKEQEKPLIVADMEIGELKIGDNIKKLYGEPTKKTTVHGQGDEQWVYDSKGITVNFPENAWGIHVQSPFEGSTPRGIHIGSTLSELMEAYPDIIKTNRGKEYFNQKSADHQYQISITIQDERVTEIFLYKPNIIPTVKEEKIDLIIYTPENLSIISNREFILSGKVEGKVPYFFYQIEDGHGYLAGGKVDVNTDNNKFETTVIIKNATNPYGSITFYLDENQDGKFDVEIDTKDKLKTIQINFNETLIVPLTKLEQK